MRNSAPPPPRRRRPRRSASLPAGTGSGGGGVNVVVVRGPSPREDRSGDKVAAPASRIYLGLGSDAVPAAISAADDVDGGSDVRDDVAPDAPPEAVPARLRRRATDQVAEVERLHREIARGSGALLPPPPSSAPAPPRDVPPNGDREQGDEDRRVEGGLRGIPLARAFGRGVPPDPPADAAAARRILGLNRLAVRLSASKSAGDGRRALDALHEAEWARRRLADELAEASPPGNEMDVVDDDDDGPVDREDGGGGEEDGRVDRTRRRQRSGRSAPRSFARKCPRFDDRGDGDRGGGRDDAARTSYIYQRMDFDEGMSGFQDLEDLDDGSFWLPSADDGRANGGDQGSKRRRAVSPAVEAVLAFNVGQIGRRAGDLDAADASYDRALAALRASTTSAPAAATKAAAITEATFRHPVAISILHNVGQIRYCRGDRAAACNAYAAARDVAADLYGDGHPHVASALNCLGVLRYHEANEGSGDGAHDGGGAFDAAERARREGLTNEAMDLFRRSLSIRRRALGPDHADVATSLNNVGRIHVQREQFEEALTHYEEALRIRRAALGTDSPDYAATAFNAGQCLHQRGELPRAATLYREFLRVALARFGSAHRDVAVALSGLAQIFQEKGEWERAREMHESSLRAGVAALGEDHAEVAMLLNRVGNFHFERSRWDDALRCYRRGLRIERAVLPRDHPNIVVTLSNLGEIHRQRSEWDEAARMYVDCLDIMRREHCEKNGGGAEAATVLSALGLIHDQRGDPCQGLICFQEALAMRQRILGNDHLDVSSTLIHIGTIFYKKGALAKALEVYGESLRIRRAVLGNDHRDVAFVLYNIALVHQQRGCHDEATEAYSETLRIERLVLGDAHRDVSMTLFKLGEVRRAAGDLDGALQFFRESLSVERSLSAPSLEEATNSVDAETPIRQQQGSAADPAAMARALNEIGNLYLARGDLAQAMEALKEASRLFRAAGLSPSNVVVSGHLLALEISCPEAAAAA